MKDPLLSICIATYNRAGFIGETLDSILAQLEDDVELLVVDGASTDNTESVVREYARREPRLRYVRLSAKGGVDQDYDKSMELARGEFCWLFTDDDLLKPGAVAGVKAAVQRGYDLVVVNAEVRNRDLSVVLGRRRIAIEEDKAYIPDHTERLFVDALTYLTFIGGVVIRRDVWLSRERKSYFGTEFVHVGVIFQNPLPGPSFIIAEPYIIIRFGYGQWKKRSFDIWMFKWPNLVWSFKEISDEAKMSVISREPWRNFRNLIIQRSDGGYDLQSYRHYFSTMRLPAPWKLCAMLIACFPRAIIIGFHYLYSRFKGQESKVFFDNRFK